MKFYLPKVGLFLGIIAYLVLLVQVNLSTAPAVLFDEFIYAQAATFDPSELSTGGFLYSWTYALAGLLPGESIYEFGRLVNIVFTVITGLALYTIARTMLSPTAAGWVAFGVSLFSISVWSHLFMPEAMYIAFVTWGFACFFWIDKTVSPRLKVSLLFSGVLLFSLSSLVKVHTLFILPAIVFALYANSQTLFERKRQRFAAAIFTSLMVIPLKLAVGFLLAGERGLRLLGEYQSAVDTILGRFFSGENYETNQGLAPAGGFYIGFEDRFVEVPTPNPIQIIGMLFDRAGTFIPIALIAFGWIVIAAMTLKFDNPNNKSRLLTTVGVLALNLFILAIGFNVFASVGGDDHSNRVLFRYVEYVFLIASVIGAMLILTGEFRNHKDWRMRARPYFVAVVFALAAFGPQARVTANYADSAFIPVMGNLWVWLPVVSLAFIATFLVTELYSQKARSILASLVLGGYAVAGILSQVDYSTTASRSTLLGIETASYVSQSDTKEYFQIVKLPQTAGRVATLAPLEKVDYGIALGTNPVNSEDLPKQFSRFIAIDQVFFNLDDDGLRYLESGQEYEVFVRADAPLRKSVPVADILRNSNFEFYSSGAVYSESGEEEIELDNPLTQASELEICILLPEDIKDRRVILKVQDFETTLQLTTSAVKYPECFKLGFGEGVNTRTISLRAPVLTNEIETGEVISTVSFGVSKLVVTEK